MAETRWLSGGRFVLFLSGLLLISFFPVLLGREAWFYRDYGFLGYPFAYFNQQALLSGSIPHWNPYIHCGVPHFAQWNTMVLYPGSLIYVLFPLPWSLAWFCVLHLLLAGVGMQRLGKELTGCSFAGAFGGVAFAFGGLVLGSVIYPNYLVAFGWMPWLYLLIRRAWRKGGRALVPAALVGTLHMLSGAPELILLSWLFLLAGLLAEFGLGRELVKPAGRFAAVVALVAGLSAFQLLPFFQLLSVSQRTAGTGSEFWSLPPLGWLNFIMPLAGSFKTPQGVFVQIGQSFLPSVYLGAPVVALALLGWYRNRERERLTESAFGIFCVLLALGGGFVVYHAVTALFPVGFARYPVKAILPIAFIVPLFAMLGVSAVNDSPKPRILALGVVVLLVVGAVANTVLNNPLPIDGQVVMTNGVVRLLLASGAVFLVVRRGALTGRSHVVASLGALLIIWLDGVSHLPVLNPTIPSDAFQAGVMRAYHEQEAGGIPKVGQGRIMLSPYAERELHTRMVPSMEADFMGQRVAQWGNLNILDGIGKVNGAATLMTEQARDIEAFLYSGTNATNIAMMDFLGVSHLTQTDEILKLQPRAGGMPLVTGGQATRAGDVDLRGASWDPRKEVFLSGVDRPATQVSIHGATYRPGEIGFSVISPQPTVVVVAETWDPNWTASVNGARTVVHRANHAFMAVEIPKGESQVLLAFQDDSFVQGTWLSLASLAVCVGLCLGRNSIQSSSSKKNSE